MTARPSDPTRFKRPCSRSPLARRSPSSACALVALIVAATAVTAPISVAPRAAAQELESPGGSARPAEAFGSLAAELHELCREAYPELLGIYFMDLLRQLPAAVLREAIAWADERARRPDPDWAPLAREFSMAGRLVLYKTSRAADRWPAPCRALAGRPGRDAVPPRFAPSESRASLLRVLGRGKVATVIAMERQACRTPPGVSALGYGGESMGCVDRSALEREPSPAPAIRNLA